MEWKLSEDQLKEYNSILQSAQDLEATLGSTQYRVFKLCQARLELEQYTKSWWDNIAKVLELNSSFDYMINREGVVKQVEKKIPGVKEDK